jgi:hypothetical protein
VFPDRSSGGGCQYQGVPPAASANIQHKQHFRIVFREACQPSFELKNLSDILETLLHAVEGFSLALSTGFSFISPHFTQASSTCAPPVGSIATSVSGMGCDMAIEG